MLHHSWRRRGRQRPSPRADTANPEELASRQPCSESATDSDRSLTAPWLRTLRAPSRPLPIRRFRQVRSNLRRCGGIFLYDLALDHSPQRSLKGMFPRRIICWWLLLPILPRTSVQRAPCVAPRCRVSSVCLMDGRTDGDRFDERLCARGQPFCGGRTSFRFLPASSRSFSVATQDDVRLPNSTRVSVSNPPKAACL